jgi:SAM-dependent methyltransferase
MERAAIGLPSGGPIDAAGQDVRKYSSRQPLVRWLLNRWLHRLRLTLGPTRVLIDVGAGEGIATSRIVPTGAFVVAVDYRRDKLILARERLPGAALIQADAGLLPLRDGAAPTVTCIEVLEHLTDPELAVAELARVAAVRCVVSVPWEPWFRLGNLLRGKNVRQVGNDPEHVQWYRPTDLAQTLTTAFDEVQVRSCFPWLVAVARPGRPRMPAARAAEQEASERPGRTAPRPPLGGEPRRPSERRHANHDP